MEHLQGNQAAAVYAIIRKYGRYREREIIRQPHRMDRSETWNDEHKVVIVSKMDQDPDGYIPGCAIDLVTHSIVG